MSQTLLQIVDQAYNELGLGTAPTTVISNTASDVVQLLNLLNGLGQDLMREYQWQAITKAYKFTTVYYQYTATVSPSSTTITILSSTTGLTTNPTYFAVTGIGIPQDTMLVSVNSGASTAVLSNTPTTAGTLVTLTFSQVIYALPSDYDRLIDDTEWDKSQRWQMMGPTSAQGWQWLKSSYITTGPRVRFRVLANLFQIWPALSSASGMGYEYIRNAWVLVASAADVSKTSFTVDTDTCMFPDRLMVEGLKLRWCRVQDYQLSMWPKLDLENGFPNRLLSIAKSADAGSKVLMMGGQANNQLITTDNIPDGNWNL